MHSHVEAELHRVPLHRAVSRAWRHNLDVSDQCEGLHGLTGDLGDQVEVLVNGQDRQPSLLRGRCDEQIRDGRSAVLATVGKERNSTEFRHIQPSDDSTSRWCTRSTRPDTGPMITAWSAVIPQPSCAVSGSPRGRLSRPPVPARRTGPRDRLASPSLDTTGSRPNRHLVGRSGRGKTVAMKIERVVPDLRASDLRRTADEHVAVLGLDVVMDHGWIVTLADSEGHQLSLVEADAS